MNAPHRQTRVLIYSHDSMGLGHLRRCQAIAHGLVEADPSVTVLILSGSPIIGSFDFRSRVDFVRVPGVIKLRNGSYTSLSLPIALEETLAIRASIMRHTAEIFDPDLFIVDKEPLGLRGEVRATLDLMRERGRPCVLGLRDILDDSALLEAEWARKRAVPALVALYDEIWVYGDPAVADPFAGLALPEAVRRKTRFTGYLRRNARASLSPVAAGIVPEEPFLLVTPGGGGDGEVMVDWLIGAYETDPGLPWPAVIVLGPFMDGARQREFLARVAAQPRLRAITFDAEIEALMRSAAGILAMGGYNTFCEILSFDRRALLVPRTEPRREQAIRADRAAALGLVQVLPDDGIRDPRAMAEALRRLPDAPPPSARMAPGLLDGLDRVAQFARILMSGEGRVLAPALIPTP
jgi:predicted glycosyltransferase